MMIVTAITVVITITRATLTIRLILAITTRITKFNIVYLSIVI